MSFIVAGDIHLSELTFKTCPDVKFDSVHSLEIIFRCAKNMVNGKVLPVILAGDIWDTARITPELLDRVIRLRAQYIDVPLYYINGNHDSLTPSWTSFLGGEITHLTTEPVTLPDGERVAGLDYLPPETFKAKVKDLSVDCDFFVVHQFIEKEENLLIPQSIPLSTLSNFKFVIAGDIHKHHFLRKDGTTCMYTGSSNIRSMIEFPRFCYITSKDKPEKLRPVLNAEYAYEFRADICSYDILPVVPCVRGCVIKYFMDTLTPDTQEPLLTPGNYGSPEDMFKEPWVFFMAPDFDPELYAALRARTDCHFILKKTKNGISEALESEDVSYSASNIKELTDLVINNINTTEAVRQIIRSMLANDKEFFDNLPKIPN